MTTRIGIIGDGNVGSALAAGLKRARHDVKTTGKDPAAVKGIADWATVIILAVPFGAIDETLRELGTSADGKVLVDVTNALTSTMELAVGFTTSGAEALQRKAPKAKVVKAFNTIFAQHMETGRVGDEPLSALIASDDASAKQTVAALATDIGFEAVDAGPLKNARHLEPLACLNIQLGYVLGHGTQVGFRFVKKT